MGYVVRERKYKTEGKPTYKAAQLVLIGKRAVLEWDKLQEAGSYFINEKHLYTEDEIRDIRLYFGPYWQKKYEEHKAQSRFVIK